jgi:hypothetical protein
MTVRDIIKEALQLLGVLAAGEDPSAEDHARGLSSFRGMIFAMLGRGIGGQTVDKIVTASPYEAQPGEKVVWAGSGSLTVTLPALLDNGRFTPMSGDRVVVTSGDQSGQWVYIGERAEWFRVGSITANTASPLGETCDTALVFLLARELATVFGINPSGFVIQRAQDASNEIYSRFRPTSRGNIDPALAGVYSTAFGGMWGIRR